jgi:hypothetical protein
MGKYFPTALYTPKVAFGDTKKYSRTQITVSRTRAEGLIIEMSLRMVLAAMSRL